MLKSAFSSCWGLGCNSQYHVVLTTVIPVPALESPGFSSSAHRAVAARLGPGLQGEAAQGVTEVPHSAGRGQRAW